MMIISAFNMLQYAATVTLNYAEIQNINKEYQKLSLLLIKIARKEQFTYQEKMTENSLRKII